MLRLALLILSLAAANSAARADYPSDRIAAAKLAAAGKHEEALELYLELAELPNSPHQQSDALHQAALCAVNLQQFDQALQLAGRIPQATQALATRLAILESARRWDDIIAEYEPVDIAAWPERLRGEAYISRGTAHAALKHGPEAARDFEAAIDFLVSANSRGYCSNLLGDACRNLLKDDERALAAYRRTHQIGTIYKRAQAAIQAADILLQRKDFPAAVAEFDRIDLTDLAAPYWRGKLLCAHGRALASAGRKTDADAKFAAALVLPELPAEIRQECEQARRK